MQSLFRCDAMVEALVYARQVQSNDLPPSFVASGLPVVEVIVCVSLW